MLQYFEIPSLDATMRKSMADGIIARVLLESGIDPKKVIYTDELENAQQPGATIGDTTDILYASPDLIEVEIVEERDEMERIARGVGLHRERYFFENKPDHVRAWASRVFYNVTVNIKRRSKSRTDLHRWCNRLNSLIDMGRYSTKLESESYFLIPMEALRLLNACYVAAETRVPRHASFKDYLKAYFSDEITVTTDVAGQKNRLAVRHSPTRVEVVYDVNGPQTGKDENDWSASFSFSYRYQRPEEVLVEHPYILNQTPIAKEYFPQPEPPFLSNEEMVDRGIVQSMQDALAYEGTRPPLLQLPYLLSDEDQYLKLHRVRPAYEVPIFGTDIAFGVENMSNPDVLSLEQVPYTWVEPIREYIKYCRERDKSGQCCIFQYQLYKNTFYIEPTKYRWDGEWLILEDEIDVTAQYYALEVLRTDWSNFPKQCLSILDKFPGVIDWIIDWLIPGRVNPRPVKPTVPDVIDHIDKDRPDNGYWLTIFNTSIIDARKMGER